MDSSLHFDIVVFEEKHRTWAELMLRENWGSSLVVTRGKIHHANLSDGFVAVINNEPKGLITYTMNHGDCEIVTLNSLKEGIGIGSKLLDAAIDKAKQLGCGRVWLVTTNDNAKAFAFYQKRNFKIAAIHCDTIKESRKIKPEVPEIGMNGIPIRDEIELEMPLRFLIATGPDFA